MNYQRENWKDTECVTLCMIFVAERWRRRRSNLSQFVSPIPNFVHGGSSLSLEYRYENFHTSLAFLVDLHLQYMYIILVAVDSDQ